jgi:hypothetical protein
MTQIFISRPSLLPTGETTEDYRKWQQEEADIVEKDKKNSGHGGGLFGGRFAQSLHNSSAIRDVEDGVDRCPFCAWEITDEGYCTSCGFEVHNGYPLSDSDSQSASYFTEDDEGAFFMNQFLDHENAMHGGLTVSDTISALEESLYGDIPRVFPNPRVPPRISAEVETRQTALRPRSIDIRGNHNRRSRLSPSVGGPYSGTATDDGSGDTDDYSTEEDDAGSLRDFVVDEVDDGHPLQLSPQSSHYDSDEATGIIEALGSFSSDEGSVRGNSQGSQESDIHELLPGRCASRPNSISVDDDSDEDPVLRSRPGVYRRYFASLESDEEAEHVNTAKSRSRRRRSTRERSCQASTNNSLPSNQTNAHSATNSDPLSACRRAVSVETDSDPELPPLARRPRARPGRTAPSRRIISDDEDDVATASPGNASVSSRQSSSGTVTIGRQSPVRQNPSNQAGLTATQPSIVLTSSPTRLNSPPYQGSYDHPGNASEDHARLSDPEPIPEYPQRTILPPRARRPRYNLSPSSRHRSRPNLSHMHQPAASRNIVNASHSDTIQRIQQIAHDRVVRRASRLLKKERTQRRARERAVVSEDSGPPTAPEGVPFGYDCHFQAWTQDDNSDE